MIGSLFEFLKMREVYFRSKFIVLCWFLGGGSFLFGVDYQRQENAGYFEGTLEYVVSHYSRKTGKAVERESFLLALTDERMLFPSLVGDLAIASLIPPDVESALVRNDKNDIILFGDGYDAYRVKSFDMTMLGLAMKGMTLMDTPTNLDPPAFLGNFELRGKRTELWRYANADGFRMDIYLCSDFRLNWGVLAKSWLFGGGGLSISRLDDFLGLGQLPVRIDAYEHGRRFVSLNLMRVKEKEVPDALVSIPHPKILNSVTQLLVQMVRN